MIDDEKIELLKRELSLLSNEYRQCVVLYYFEHYSLKKVAKKLNISLEMSKYYLFKTRKKLKEGMNMNREFGRKSYDPEKFYFSNIYFGNYNSYLEYLFNRKIVGNIPINNNYGASVFNPNVFNKEFVWEEFVNEVNNNINKFVVINDKTLVDNCLKSAYAEIKELYFKLYDIMKDTLNSYSPKNIHNDLEGATFNVLYQQTIGVICYDLINSNILETPSESYSASIIYKNNNL